MHASLVCYCVWHGVPLCPTFIVVEASEGCCGSRCRDSSNVLVLVTLFVVQSAPWHFMCIRTTQRRVPASVQVHLCKLQSTDGVSALVLISKLAVSKSNTKYSYVQLRVSN